jgi:nucleoside-diphosphate-sugar epimerase
MGAKTVKAELTDPSTLSAIPEDIDYVVNAAVVKSGDWGYDLATNAEAVGHLIARCRNAKAFVHISTTGVYEYTGHEPRQEDSAPLADNHRVFLPTYSISKIAGEQVCRFAAHHFGVPTTIARLSVPYGDNGGWPYMHLMQMKAGQPIMIHPERPNYYNPLHIDDYMEKLPRLLAVASKDVTLVNFGGSQRVAIEEWCDYLGQLTGLRPLFHEDPRAFGSLCIDTTRMHQLIGETKVDWRDGLRSMVRALAPDLLAA